MPGQWNEMPPQLVGGWHQCGSSGWYFWGEGLSDSVESWWAGHKEWQISKFNSDTHKVLRLKQTNSIYQHQQVQKSNLTAVLYMRRVKQRLHSEVHIKKTWGSGHTLQQEKYFLDIWKKKGWKWTETESGTGTGLPERLWKIHPWRWGEFDWQGPDQCDRILKFALPDLEVGLYYLLSYPSLNKFHCCTFGYFYKLILQVGQTCKPVT